MPRNHRILVSGASIAGPALALWLDRYGFDVTIVEKAAGIRPGGLPVDFKGETHRTVLQRMGILEDVRRARAPAAGDGIIVDARGRRIATVPAAFSGGDIEIARGDLARLLFERTAGRCEYRFDDTITSLSDTAEGVAVTFARGAPGVFDLVVGADGIHSNVRALAFGPERDYVRHLGYHYALANLAEPADGTLREDLMYNEPRRMAATGGAGSPAFFVFAADPLAYRRDDVASQKRFLMQAYEGCGWKVPDMMRAIPGAADFYMDAISRVTIDRYAQGRVVLLGDAAYGNALGGFGTGLAIVGAYVLAGELHAARGDHAMALRRYETRFRGYARVSQKVNAGKLLAPSSRLGLYARNRLFSVAPLFQGAMRLMDHFATDIDLEDYAKASNIASGPSRRAPSLNDRPRDVAQNR